MESGKNISLHGGHSGQFCLHASDRLEEIINRYIDLEFTAVGITEHAPPENDKLLYPDEKEAGMTAADLLERFSQYIHTVKQLQNKYAGRITIYAGMETETCGNYIQHTKQLIQRFRPDYIVGSVHHVDNICFDYSAEEYNRLVHRMGSTGELYKAYFDLQYEMIGALKPFVVGHLDLIRIYDSDYDNRLKEPDILSRIKRNLELIKKFGLVVDYNLRSLLKGAKEPYISEPILKIVKDLGIPAVPGDDSHSVSQAGMHVDTAVAKLEKLGFDTQWPEPVLIK